MADTHGRSLFSERESGLDLRGALDLVESRVHESGHSHQVRDAEESPQAVRQVDVKESGAAQDQGGNTGHGKA